MKRILIILWLVFMPMMFATTYALEASETQQQTASPTWIEVGTVVGESYRGGNWYLTGPKELKLYVMYLGEKLIYRVEWNGNYYPVVYNDSGFAKANAYARIPGWVYKYENNTDGTRKKITDEGKVLFNVPSW